MKKMILKVFLGFGMFWLSVTPVFGSNCDSLKDRWEQDGYGVTLNLIVTELLNATNSYTKAISFRIFSDLDDCDEINNKADLKTDFRLQVDSSHSYAGIYNPNLSGKPYVGARYIGYVEMSVHNAVMSAILAEIGFGTFESNNSGPYINLLSTIGQNRMQIPSKIDSNRLFGTGSHEGKLYQIVLDSVEIQ